MEALFRGIFDSSTQSVIDVGQFSLCVAVSLLIGLFLSFVYTYKSRYTQSFVISLCLLPAVVCVVIMMVNGNVGAGVAVAGAFSLVRFRSVPGTAKEIGTIFLGMGAGMIAGMGYLGYAALFTVLLGLVMLFLNMIGFGLKKSADMDKMLRITIPEDLDYVSIFDDLFEKYTLKAEMESVKTTNMGSLFKLTYHIVLKEQSKEKEFIDALRERNGNLEISLGRCENLVPEL